MHFYNNQYQSTDYILSKIDPTLPYCFKEPPSICDKEKVKENITGSYYFPPEHVICANGDYFRNSTDEAEDTCHVSF